jgi:hypothetical protein
VIILVMIVASGIIGWFAQTQRHRPGAMWASMVFVLGLPWMMYMGFGSVESDANGAVGQTGSSMTDVLYSVIPPFIICFVLLVVMPKLKPVE